MNSYLRSPFKLLLERLFALILFLIFLPIILPSVLVSAFLHNSTGFYLQKRVGLNKRMFNCIKIQTMLSINPNERSNSITVSSNPRITKFGKFLRRYKIDELTQLINVIFSEMTFIGARPDVEGYLDKLEGENKLLLKFKPGITGYASIFFNKEENLLTNYKNPKKYNDLYIWPLKVYLNRLYIKDANFLVDLYIVFATIGLFRKDLINYLKTNIYLHILNLYFRFLKIDSFQTISTKSRVSYLFCLTNVIFH